MPSRALLTIVMVAAAGARVSAQPGAPAAPALDQPPAPTEPPPAPATPDPAAGPPAATPAGPTITVGGYLEEYYQLDAQDPSNRLTNLRGFDNRSRTFTLSNVALSVKGESGPISGLLVFQVGHTPSTYYLAEPVSPGTPSVDTSSVELWKYLQVASLAAKAPHDFLIEAGLFPSPIGLEVIPVKDDWSWSRSNLFFGLPFYHTGARVTHPLGNTRWAGTLAVYNGWSSVVDNNDTPSVAVSAAYTSSKTTAQLLYFGGIERPSGAPEGHPWRNLFDAYIITTVTDDVSIAANGDAGFEQNTIGTSAWAAGAVYAKFQLGPALYAAVRGDYFYEKAPEKNGMSASAMFWPVTWVAEGTATLAYQPVDHLSLRLEYRHDQAASDAYFGDDVAIDPVTLQFVPNRDMQDTLTFGVTVWF